MTQDGSFPLGVYVCRLRVGREVAIEPSDRAALKSMDAQDLL